METPSDSLALNQTSSGFRRFRGAFGLSKAITIVIRRIIYGQSPREQLNKFSDHNQHDDRTGDIKVQRDDISYNKTDFSDGNRVNGKEPKSAPLKRKLAAVLLADVVGYSRLMSLDEENTHVALADYAKELIEPNVAAHGGRLIRTKGDSFLAEFDSAISAVRCGLDVQDALTDHNAALPNDRRIRLRIGINTGDVIVDEHDIYGNSVNIAARLEGLAEPGEIYVTRSVRDQLEGHPGLLFEDRGERRVKNFKTPIRVYRVKRAETNPLFLIAFARRFSPARLSFSARRTVFSGAILATVVSVGVVGLPMWRDQWDIAPRASIVVLPFENFSGDPKETYFADAITDDLTTDLSRLPGSFVISRATAFTYKGKAVDVREVGRECNVRYVLEGSIRRVGVVVQTNAQLIDTATAAHIWADRFENEISDLYALQQAITGRIAASLDIQLARAEARRAANTPANPDALDLRFRAMGLYISGITPEHTLNARWLLEKAVGLDPKSAESWAWLADLLASDYLNRWNNTGTVQIEEADRAVREALALDRYNYLAHFARGFIYRAKGENTAALDAFAEALRLNRNFARGYAQQANELINLGRPDEAPPMVEKAIRLSPRDPSLGVFYWNLGRANFFADRYHAAIPWLQKAVELRPNLWHNWLYLVSAYALTGEDRDARKILAEFNNHQLYRDRKFTLSVVEDYEQANPNENPVIVEGRKKFHEGLLKAGMSDV
jgi:class 3 adenylate cyclase/TolB-like protein/Tfp pilus assembly protein PilF